MSARTRRAGERRTPRPARFLAVAECRGRRLQSGRSLRSGATASRVGLAHGAGGDLFHPPSRDLRTSPTTAPSTAPTSAAFGAVATSRLVTRVPNLLHLAADR